MSYLRKSTTKRKLSALVDKAQDASARKVAATHTSSSSVSTILNRRQVSNPVAVASASSMDNMSTGQNLHVTALGTGFPPPVLLLSSTGNTCFHKIQ